ncbi:MAG TPA: DUF1684 domain-containing protein [Gemmatimonadales bacterium]|nr:DUF1684 domain-containing protein [Gemmatimonadales bacterium]
MNSPFRMAARQAGICALVLVLLDVPAVWAQTSGVAAERAEYMAWLTTAAVSPLRAIAQQPIGSVVRLGPSNSDVPLAGVAEHRVRQQGGSVMLESDGGKRAMPRGLPIRVGAYTLSVGGAAGRAVLTVFGDHPSDKRPEYYELQPALVFVGALASPEQRGTVRVLGVDGTEVEAAEAGSVVVALGDERVRLRVLRMPTQGSEESELEIFFRDGTNGRGTYPAGRFVQLVPESGNRYRLDFNRARNPFCAYSSAYPCPAPWRGNAFRSPVEAGERYEGVGTAGPEPPAGAR